MNKSMQDSPIKLGDIVVRRNKPRTTGEVLEIWEAEPYCVPIEGTYNDYREVKGEQRAKVKWSNNYTSSVKLSSLQKSAGPTTKEVSIPQNELIKLIAQGSKWINCHQVDSDRYLVLRQHRQFHVGVFIFSCKCYVRESDHDDLNCAKQQYSTLLQEFGKS